MSDTSASSSARAPLPRTQVRRKPARQVSERERALDVLRAGRVAHVGVCDSAGSPRVIPVAYGLEADVAMLLHGSTASQLFKALASGSPACATVTLLDGLVVASSSFNSSMNYRSVMIFGCCTVLDGDAKLAAVTALSEHLFPGRSADFRALTEQELKATSVVRLPLDEMSMKVRAEGVNEDDGDKDPERWTGVLPVHPVFGEPQPSAHVQAPLPDYISRWLP